MTGSSSRAPNDAQINEIAKKLIDALAQAGQGSNKLSDIVDAAIKYALALCGEDRKLAAEMLGLSPEHLDYKLDSPRNGDGVERGSSPV